MKRFAVALLCCGLLGLSVLAQTGVPQRTRVMPTPTPTPIQTPDSTNQNKRPPVLIGGGSGNGSVTPSPTPPADSSDTIKDDGDVIRVETNLVTIPVSVLDRDGRFIPGLRQQDFQIFEDGVEQKVEYFAPVEQPFTVVLLIDVSPSTAFKIEEIQNAAITFINQLRPEDRVAVISFDERVHVLSQPTNDRYVLRNVIRQSDFGNGTSLYEAVDYSISQQLRKIEGRKAVVLFTDGVDTSSRSASYQSTVRGSEELDAMIYPIRYNTMNDMQGGGGGGGSYPYPNQYPSRRRNRGGGGGGGGVLGAILGGIINGGNVSVGNGRGGGGRGGNGSSSNEYEVGRRYLEDLARTSGGREFEADSLYNIDAAFSGIAEELRCQYSIGYYPENVGQTGQRKQIKVRTNRTEAVVRAKNSYIVGEAEAKTATKAPPRINSSRLPF